MASPAPPPARSNLAFAGGVFLVTCALTWVGLRLWPGEPDQPQLPERLQESLDSEAIYAPRPTHERAPLGSQEARRVQVVAEAARSVVHIRARQDMDVAKNQVRPEGQDPARVPEGTGSGVIWNRRGYIVTNAHLVDGQTEVTVQLADGSRWQADYVGALNSEDLAVICIGAPPERLVPVRLGRSEGLEVGQDVYALGNPFGLDLSLTVGVLSGLGRETRTPSGAVLSDIIQTDAAINPGNSGGPLLDSSGALIGINTSIPAETRTSSGIGFALPVDRVNLVVPELIRAGIEVRWELGLKLAADPQSEQLLGPLAERGVVVLAVEPGSPCAGSVQATVPRGELMQLGDVIVGVGDQPSPDRPTLMRLLDDALKDPQEPVRLQLLRRPVQYRITVNQEGRMSVVPLQDAPATRLEYVVTPVRRGAEALPVAGSGAGPAPR